MTNELIGIYLDAAIAVATLLTVIVALIGISRQGKRFRESLQVTHYAELDSLYIGLLKAGVERPYLRQAGVERTEEQAAEYDIYAHMAWCVVETIFDRAEADPDPELMDVWFSAIEIENDLHRDWFERGENSLKFRQKFRDFIRSKFPHPTKPNKRMESNG